MVNFTEIKSSFNLRKPIKNTASINYSKYFKNYQFLLIKQKFVNNNY